MPEFDPHAAPADPVTLFPRWLEAAVKDAVPAPHAHFRLRYRRTGSAWTRQLLWP
jgi:pyridoxine/pyridoxamine 5'-phosphate oxidase